MKDNDLNLVMHDSLEPNLENDDEADMLSILTTIWMLFSSLDLSNYPRNEQKGLLFWAQRKTKGCVLSFLTYFVFVFHEQLHFYKSYFFF